MIELIALAESLQDEIDPDVVDIGISNIVSICGFNSVKEYEEFSKRNRPADPMSAAAIIGNQIDELSHYVSTSELISKSNKHGEYSRECLFDALASLKNLKTYLIAEHCYQTQKQ